MCVNAAPNKIQRNETPTAPKTSPESLGSSALLSLFIHV